MEFARNLLSPSSPFPRRTHRRSSVPPSHSSSPSSVFAVYMLHDQASVAATLTPPSSISRQLPTSILQEQRDESRLLSHIGKEDKITQSVLLRKQLDSRPRLDDGVDDADYFLENFEQQLLSWPILSSISPSLARESVATDFEKLIDPELFDMIDKAQEALSTSKEAAFLAEKAALPVVGSDPDSSLSPRINGTPDMKEIVVPSTRLLERRSKRRKVSKAKVTYGSGNPKKGIVDKRLKAGYDPNDPLRLFLRGPESRKLLTVEEECRLIGQIQDFNKLLDLKRSFQTQYDHEPTMVEWAHSAGLSCTDLQSQLISGNRCRERLIIANLRMVVHIAKQYLGKGLSFQDLLQEGSMGLMRSVQKFKPQSGTRFPSYAYWWVRQSMRKAIFQHSRTIRLPENVYTLQSKVAELRSAYIQENRKCPTKQELAEQAGITVQKLQHLYYLTRQPLSIQQSIWFDQETTIQNFVAPLRGLALVPSVIAFTKFACSKFLKEVTADTTTDTPDVGVEKQLMRVHVRKLLKNLSPKERRVIKLRFGIGRDQQYSLSEIGAMFGISKERVRQIESRAFYKLKKVVGNQDLRAYADLLV